MNRPAPEEIEEAAELLARFVSIPSLALAEGATPPDCRHGEAQMAEAVVDYLEAAGVRPQVEEVEPGRPQVTARIGNGDGPDLLITSHMDTVPPVDWAGDPFEPIRCGDRLTGLGSCDDGASLVAMLLAFTRLARAGAPLNGTLTFIAMVGEETFGVGSRHMVRSGYRPDAAIVGEPTGLRVARVESGNIRWRIGTTGRSVHGSRPWDGDNAIFRMTEVLRLLQDEVAPACAALSHPLTGRAAFNAGVIQGGAAVNIVPSSCYVTVERRVLPGEDPVREMEAINALLRERIGSEHLQFEPPLSVNHPVDTPEDAAPVRAMCGALEACGLPCEPIGVAYGSDANRFAGVGIPSVIFGPGSIAQAHTNDEWVDLVETAVAARVLEDAARRFLGR